MVSLIPKLLDEHRRFFAQKSNGPVDAVISTLQSGLEDSLRHAKGIIPFLERKVDPGGMRKNKANAYVCWWDCEVTRNRNGYSSKRCPRTKLLQCSRVSPISLLLQLQSDQLLIYPLFVSLSSLVPFDHLLL